jgi:hypothetical protein
METKAAKRASSSAAQRWKSSSLYESPSQLARADNSIVRGSLAVDRHYHARESELRRWSWSKWTLAFPDPEVERSFDFYYSSIRGVKTRRGLMLLSFFYCLYVSSLQWGSKETSSRLFALRGIFLLFTFGGFLVSFVRPRLYKQHMSSM